MNTILHFDFIYQIQSLSTLLPGALELDFTHMEGVKGYCDETSANLLRTQLNPISLDGIHFIGSGNYHYISLFFLEKISFPFSLVVFDHHTDMQYSMFGDLLSCGSWIINAITALPFLKEVLLIGIGEESLHGTKKMTLTQPVFSIVRETETFLKCQYNNNKKETSITILKENYQYNKWSILSNTCLHFPYYLSIDKDILSRSELETDWDQGSLSLAALKNACIELLNNSHPIGTDICGEPTEDGNVLLGKQVNQELISLFYNN